MTNITERGEPQPKLDMDPWGGMMMGPQMEKRMVISRETPVIDHLEGGREFAKKLENAVMDEDGDTTLLVLAETGSGKEVVAGELLYRIDHSARVKHFEERIADKGKRLSRHFLNTSMGLRRAQDTNRVTSEWGKFGPAEFAIGTEEMIGMYEQIKRTSERPSLDVIETIAVTPGLDIGASLVTRIIDDVNKKPDSKLLVALVVPDAPVQDENSAPFRDILNETDDVEIIEARAKELGMEIDESLKGKVEEYRRSMGNRIGMERTRVLMNNDLVAHQEMYRKMDNTLPHLSADQLQSDPDVRAQALRARYMHLAYKVWGLEEEQVLIARNTKLPDRKINLYHSLVRTYAVY